MVTTGMGTSVTGVVADRPALLMVGAAMMGLPAMLFAHAPAAARPRVDPGEAAAEAYISELRERYARDEIEIEEFEAGVERALRGEIPKLAIPKPVVRPRGESNHMLPKPYGAWQVRSLSAQQAAYERYRRERVTRCEVCGKLSRLSLCPTCEEQQRREICKHRWVIGKPRCVRCGASWEVHGPRLLPPSQERVCVRCRQAGRALDRHGRCLPCANERTLKGGRASELMHHYEEWLDAGKRGRY